MQSRLFFRGALSALALAALGWAAIGSNIQSGVGSGSGGGGASALSPTAIKTSAYTASASDLVLTDSTSGTVPITLPTAPADKTTVAVKMVIQGGTNTTTIACGGSDHINTATGPTSGTLSLLNQSVQLQYQAANSIWYVVGDDIPLGQTDLRYLRVANNLSDVTAATARTNLGVQPTASPTFTGQASFKTLGYASVFDNGNSGAAKTIDWGTNGNMQKVTLTGNVTFTFTAPTYPGYYELETIQDGTGSRTIVWPGTVKGPSGVLPAPTAAANSRDIIRFRWDGTKYDSAIAIPDSR